MSNSKTNILYSENFILLVVVLAMLSNIEHAASVYHTLSHAVFQNTLANWVYAAIVVLIIDLAVLVLVINGRHITAGCYALGMFFINVVYYGGMNELQLVDLATGNQVNRVVSIVIYSVMFTYSIYTFSRMYLERISRMQKVDENEQRVSSLSAEVSSLQAQLKQLGSKNEAEVSRSEALMSKLDAVVLEWQEKYKQLQNHSEAELSKVVQDKKTAQAALGRMEIELEQAQARLKAELDKVTCPACSYIAKDAYALNAHKKSCVNNKQLLLSSN